MYVTIISTYICIFLNPLQLRTFRFSLIFGPDIAPYSTLTLWQNVCSQYDNGMKIAADASLGKALLSLRLSGIGVSSLYNLCSMV